jgi:superfamily I DNA/RNA helicase
MLDQGLNIPFFKKAVDDYNEVDFYRFSNYYYPHLDETIRSMAGAPLLFTEITTHIKGSLAALHSLNGELSRESYIDLSSHRSSTLTRDQRGIVYNGYRKYEKLKQSNTFDFDRADFVCYIYRSLSNNGYAGIDMTRVYVDEVQDLSPAQIALFKFVCKDSHAFVMAGDTAQTVSL